ncbi:atp11 [Moelleriella libera RCEF 2490]|uniref:Atp11 n=1 Tax=Moelleriella libera RCEF 2490 TaxID=1081109 RepID=A0A162I9Y0_9HYPO|nr:atp11 [Moelleriella libera RCEF 2490]
MSPVVRQAASTTLRSVARLHTQRRWAQVHDIRFLATRQLPQAVLDKYRDKLEGKARSEGLGSIEELKTAYSAKIDAERKKDSIESPLPSDTTIPQAPNTPVSQPNRGPLPIELDGEETKDGNGRDPKEQAPSSPPPPSSKRASSKSAAAATPAVQTLDEIVDVAKIRALPEKELTAIWRLRHANSPQKLCAVIPTTAYQAMEATARRSPQFVLPVPHESQGAEIHFMQWTFDAPSNTSTVLFTQLAEYKTRGEFAQPHTTVTHHLDLAGDKGLVLMQGQTLDDRGVSPAHAKWLVLCLQRFYGAWNDAKAGLDGLRKERADERKKLVEWFGSGDSRFSVEKLLEEAERMG